MTSKALPNAVLPLMHRLTEWWRLVNLGAVILVLALSPSSYRRDNRLQLVWHIYRNTAPFCWASAEMHALVRMFLVLLAVEVISLMGNYY
jgi:phospholipid/cholesterol/gamma-HCH transport system permease protein